MIPCSRPDWQNIVIPFVTSRHDNRIKPGKEPLKEKRPASSVRMAKIIIYTPTLVMDSRAFPIEKSSASDKEA